MRKIIMTAFDAVCALRDALAKPIVVVLRHACLLIAILVPSVEAEDPYINWYYNGTRDLAFNPIDILNGDAYAELQIDGRAYVAYNVNSTSFQGLVMVPRDCPCVSRLIPGGSRIDGALESHIHDAIDWSVNIAAGTCLSCGSSGSSSAGAPPLTLSRWHRYRDQGWRGSFGPGVFSNVDHQLRVYGHSATTAGMVEWFDPTGDAPILLTGDGQTAGVFKDGKFNSIKACSLLNGAGTPAANMIDARQAIISRWDGSSLVFEIIPAAPDIPNSDGFGRFIAEKDTTGRVITTVLYQQTVPASTAGTDFGDNHASPLWKVKSVADAFGSTALFTYGTDCGQYVVTAITAPDGAVISYGYGSTGLVGLNSISYRDGSASSFSTYFDGYTGLQVVNYADAGTEGIHRSKSAFLTVAEVEKPILQTIGHTDARIVYNGTIVYAGSNRVRKILNGIGEEVYLGWRDANGSTTYAQEAGVYRRSDTSGGKPVAAYRAVDATLAWQKIYDYTTDAQGRITTRTDAAGGTTAFSRDAVSGRINGIGVSGPDGSLPSTHQVFDPVTGLLASEVDRLGTTTTYTYDAARHRTSRTRQSGSATIMEQWVYDAAGNLVGEIDANGNRTDHAYDAAGRRTSTTAPADIAGGSRLVTLFGYDTAGRLTTTTDAMGRITKFAYDGRGRLATTTFADGSIEISAYGTNGPGMGMLVSRTDRNGAVTTYSYDGAGRKIGEIVTALRSSTPDSVRAWTYRSGTEEIATATSDGTKTVTAYDAFGRSLAVTRQASLTDQETSRVSYDALDRSWVTTDERGRRTWFVYNANNQVIRRVEELLPGTLNTIPVDAASARTSLLGLSRQTGGNPSYLIEDATFDAEHNRLSQVDTLGVTSLFSYDGFGRLVAQIQADRRSDGSVNGSAARSEFRYDAVGNQTRVIQPRSFTRQADGSFVVPAGSEIATAMAYTGRNLLAATTEADGTPLAVTSFRTYTPTGKLATVSDPRNPSWLTIYGYGACCDRLTQITDPLGFVTSYTYDAVGNQISITDPNHNIVSMAYDAIGRVIGRTDGRGKTVSVLYDQNLTDGLGLDQALPTLASGLGFGIGSPGSARRTTDSTGVSTYEVSDGMGRLVRQIDGAGHVTTLTYVLGSDGLETVTSADPLGHATVRALDGHSLVRRTMDPTNAITTMKYDAAGHILEQRDANGVADAATYDALGRQISHQDAFGHVTGMAYDAQGLLINQTDGFVRATKWTYDVLGRKVTEADRNNAVTRFDYDAASNLLSITDAQGGVTSYAYTSRNQMISETFPGASGGMRSYTYDSGMRLSTRTDQKGVITTYSYDPANRLTKRTYSTGIVDTLGYDDMGRLTSAVSGRYGTTITRFYQNGFLQKETQQRPDGTATVTTTRDGANRPVMMALDDGTSLGTSYSNRDQVIAASINGVQAFSRTYDTGGRIADTTYGNGLHEVRGYDQNLVKSLSVGTTTQPTAIAGISYQFDANRRKTLEQDVAVDGEKQTFAYDNADRLTSWSRTPGAIGATPPASDSQTWSLSPVADWNSTTINGAVQARTHSVVHETTAIGGVAVTSDLNGNLAKDYLGNVYTWDEENRLITATVRDEAEGVTSRASMVYDALGRRLSRSVFRRTTDFVLNEAQIIQERDQKKRPSASEQASDGTLPSDTDPAPPGSVLQMAGARYINHQPANEDIPDGWIADKGRAQGMRTNGLTYGWVTAANAPVALDSTQSVVRDIMPQPELDTFNRPVLNSTASKWRFQVPSNGIYAVAIVAGDAASLVHTNNLVINGVALTDPDPYNASATPGYNLGDFDGWAQDVTVTDGYITISAGIGALDPTICFVEIGPKDSHVDAAVTARMAKLVMDATNRTGGPAFRPASQTPRSFAYGGDYIDAPIAMKSGTGTDAKAYYLHENSLHSIHSVTDATGQIVEQYSYSAYGDRKVLGSTSGRSAIGMTRGFTGYPLDEDSGHYYARNRYYSPVLGKFLSKNNFGRNIGASYSVLRGDHADIKLINTSKIYAQDPYVESMNLYWGGMGERQAVDPSGQPIPILYLAGAVVIGGTAAIIYWWRHSIPSSADKVDCTCPEACLSIKGIASARNILKKLLEEDSFKDQQDLFSQLSKHGVEVVGQSNGLTDGAAIGMGKTMTSGVQNLITFYESTKWLGPNRPGYTNYPPAADAFGAQQAWAGWWGAAEVERLDKVVVDLKRLAAARGCNCE